MVIPQSYVAALLLTILSMICWGSWANTQKLAGKWRFELFYFDYSFGVLLAAVIAAFTFGTFGDSDYLPVVDNIGMAPKRNMFYGFAAGAVFNLANMLLVAAISIAGLAVAFPVGIGLALVIGVIWSYAIRPAADPRLLFAGAALVVGAIIVDALAYAKHARAKAALEPPPPPPAKGKKAAPRARKSPVKGIVLSLVSGVLMGSFYPLVEMGKGRDVIFGLGPYSVALFFAAGVFLTTFVYNLYFMNLPVQGQPISMMDYFTGTGRQHLLGIAGGVIWCVGAIANFAAASAPAEVNVGPAVSYALGQGATMISALWGLLVWKEFAGASSKVRTLLVAMLVLFVVGLALVSIAPLYGT